MRSLTGCNDPKKEADGDRGKKPRTVREHSVRRRREETKSYRALNRAPQRSAREASRTHLLWSRGELNWGFFDATAWGRIIAASVAKFKTELISVVNRFSEAKNSGGFLRGSVLDF